MPTRDIDKHKALYKKYEVRVINNRSLTIYKMTGSRKLFIKHNGE